MDLVDAANANGDTPLSCMCRRFADFSEEVQIRLITSFCRLLHVLVIELNVRINRLNEQRRKPMSYLFRGSVSAFCLSMIRQTMLQPFVDFIFGYDLLRSMALSSRTSHTVTAQSHCHSGVSVSGLATAVFSNETLCCTIASFIAIQWDNDASSQWKSSQ